MLSDHPTFTEEQKKLQMVSKLEALKFQHQSDKSVCLQNPQTPLDNPQADSASLSQEQTASFQNTSLLENRRLLQEETRIQQNDSQFSMQMKQFQSQTPLLPTLANETKV